MQSTLLFDCEGNGLYHNVTKIHCIAAVDPDTNERFDWKPDQIPQALETLEKADRLVAHHGISYDYRALDKCYGFKTPFEKQKDSLVISRLIYPGLRDSDAKLVERGRLPGRLCGAHSIEGWGHRLGVHKGDYDGGWDNWSPEMHSYMIQDAEVLAALWKHLDADSYSQDAIELEHRIQRLCVMMNEEGWPFDEERASRLHVELMVKLKPIERSLREEFGFWYRSKNRKLKAMTDPTTGKEVEVYEWFEPKVDSKKYGYVKGQPCTQLQKVYFNPGSRQHIIRCLMRMGWKPERWTDSGQPVLDDAVLEKLSEQFPQGGALVEYLLIDKRIGQLATGDKAWLKQVGPDGRLHGTINPMGTSTSRASHSDPNLGQVPACKNPYGKECRECFTVPKGWSLIGADQAGLQLRCLGHYLAPYDNGEFGKAVASGDPHWRTVQAVGFTSGERITDEADPSYGLHEIYREKGAKTLIYATVFGCRDRKAGSIIRDCLTTARTKNSEWSFAYDRYFGDGQSDPEVGGPIREAFYSKLGLEQRIKTESGYERRVGLLPKLERIRKDPDNPFPGSVPGLDGRWVPARTDHSALAALLQSAEAIICKRWACDAYDALIAAGFKWGFNGGDFVFVGWIHDELQVAVRGGLEEAIGAILVRCAKAAGAPYKFRVPLASKAKVGRNWSETH